MAEEGGGMLVPREIESKWNEDEKEGEEEEESWQAGWGHASSACAMRRGRGGRCQRVLGEEERSNNKGCRSAPICSVLASQPRSSWTSRRPTWDEDIAKTHTHTHYPTAFIQHLKARRDPLIRTTLAYTLKDRTMWSRPMYPGNQQCKGEKNPIPSNILPYNVSDRIVKNLNIRRYLRESSHFQQRQHQPDFFAKSPNGYILVRWW